MRIPSRFSPITFCLLALGTCLSEQAGAVSLDFVASQADIGSTFFPGGGLPYVTVPWRTSSNGNRYATGDGVFPDRYYGKDGYALFATTFTYPNANLVPGNAFIDTEGDEDFVNILNLPSWVASSQILTTRMAGGYAYALIDDPVLMDNGERWWSFDGVNYPPPTPTNGTGQNPWVKMGFLDGADLLGNLPENTPSGRWAFTVGPNPPSAFRIGVMTGGMDADRFAPSEVFLQQYDVSNPLVPVPIGSPVQTGALSGTLKNRFVDMHFFDIFDAQEGDTFFFGATAAPNTGNGTGAGIAGFSFDVLPDLSADFDEDDDVDGFDFLTWQQNFEPGGFIPGLPGTPHSLGDANFTNEVDGADLSMWESEFGDTPPPFSASSVAVPEPSTLLLAAGALLCLVTRSRSK